MRGGGHSIGYFCHLGVDLHLRVYMRTDGIDHWEPEATTGYGQPPVIEDLKDPESADQYSSSD